MIEQLKNPVLILSLVCATLVGVVLTLSAVVVLESLEDDREIAEVVVPAGGSPGVLADGEAVAPERPDRDDIKQGSSEFVRVAEAARGAVGGGTVLSIERSDDLGEAYEVEIMTSKSEVDVALDRNLRQVPNLRYDE